MNRLWMFLVGATLVSLPASAVAETLQGTLYKAQQCDCCEAHAEYLRKNGNWRGLREPTVPTRVLEALVTHSHGSEQMRRSLLRAGGRREMKLVPVTAVTATDQTTRVW